MTSRLVALSLLVLCAALVRPGPAAGQNNGKIITQIDNTSGEQVTFAYDSLNRLICAAGASTAQAACLPSQSSNWGQQFKYDPFGNLTDKLITAGTVPPSITTEPHALRRRLRGR